MKLSIEKIESAQNCDIEISEVLNKKERNLKTKTMYSNNITLNSSTDTFESNNLVNSNYNKKFNNETNQNDLIDNVQVYQDLPFVNTNECMEIDTNNLITISEDQLVKIEYQNANGIINTEYIVNEEIFNVHIDNQEIDNNYVNLINVNNLYQEENDDEICPKQERIQIESDTENTTLEICSTQILERHQSLLSPQSEDDNVSETDLTSLNWLHNITNIMSVPNLPTPPVSPKPKKKPQNSNQEDLTININFYKKNGDKKPPFSYATLICMAMGKNGNKMTLSAIYHWIRENFLYYRKAHPSWQVCTNCFSFYSIL